MLFNRFFSKIRPITQVRAAVCVDEGEFDANRCHCCIHCDHVSCQFVLCKKKKLQQMKI